jgi:hypothetical protein
MTDAEGSAQNEHQTAPKPPGSSPQEECHARLPDVTSPTDFDEPSKEAYRVARSLAQALDARVVAFRVVSPPAIVTEAGRISLDPNAPEPAEDWGGCRVALARFRRDRRDDGLSRPLLENGVPQHPTLLDRRLP